MSSVENLVFETFEHAPLIYTLGVMHFPKLPSAAFERLVEVFHEQIREQGYPFRDDVDAPSIRANFSQGGFGLTQQETLLRQFATPERAWAFIVTDEMLALHTNTHEEHRQFVRRFRSGIKLLSSIDSTAIEWIDTIGVRYVNLIAPRKGEGLRDYLRCWALPLAVPTFLDGSKFPITESIYVISCSSEWGRLRYQALRNPPVTMPPELASPLVHANRWAKERPDHEFALIDLEHVSRFEPLQSFDLEEICGRTEQLCQFVGEWFLGGATDHAIRVWRGK